MVKDEYFTKIEEKINRNPFVSANALEKELPCSRTLIVNRIKELAEMENVNAQIWLETIKIRSNYKRFGYVIQLFAYAAEHKLTVEDVSDMALLNRGGIYSEKGSILSVLKIRPHIRRRDKILLNTKLETLKLMAICCEYDPNGEARYKVTSEQISNALKKYV